MFKLPIKKVSVNGDEQVSGQTNASPFLSEYLRTQYDDSYMCLMSFSRAKSTFITIHIFHRKKNETDSSGQGSEKEGSGDQG